MNESQEVSVEQNDMDHMDHMEDSIDQLGEKFLTFMAKGEIYGAEVDRIKEIIEYGTITRVPLTPNYLRGVINLRGNVVPVVDLATRLGKVTEDVSKRTCIIIVEMKTADEEVVDIGFVVDEVESVMNILEEQITAAPQFGTDIRPDFISGMAQLKDQFVVLLQLEEVLSITELAELVELEKRER